MGVNWLTAHIYAEAMKVGSEFPPILVGNYGGKFYIVDGWHRVEAKKELGEEYISAQIKRFENLKDLFLAAVKANITHGRALGVQERVRIIDKLREMKFTYQEVSKILKIPIDSIKKLQVRVIMGPDGKPIYTKGMLFHAEADPTEVDQTHFSVRNVTSLLQQLIDLLESGEYPLKDSSVKAMTERLYDLLSKLLGA
jgi:hypothetical protein